MLEESLNKLAQVGIESTTAKSVDDRYVLSDEDKDAVDKYIARVKRVLSEGQGNGWFTFKEVDQLTDNVHSFLLSKLGVLPIAGKAASGVDGIGYDVPWNSIRSKLTSDEVELLRNTFKLGINVGSYFSSVFHKTAFVPVKNDMLSDCVMLCRLNESGVNLLRGNNSEYINNATAIIRGCRSTMTAIQDSEEAYNPVCVGYGAAGNPWVGDEVLQLCNYFWYSLLIGEVGVELAKKITAKEQNIVKALSTDVDRVYVLDYGTWTVEINRRAMLLDSVKNTVVKHGIEELLDCLAYKARVKYGLPPKYDVTSTVAWNLLFNKE